MMEHYGIWSALPPVVAIALAIRTRQVFISLLAGVWLGWIIQSNWNPFSGTLLAISGLVDVFKSDGSTQTILFTLFIGSLIAFVQRSGGVAGFNEKLGRHLTRHGASNGAVRKKIQLLASLTGLIIFVESNISSLTVGTLFRPVFDRLKIPREKLAYLADSTSAPSSMLIPLNAWGGFVMGLLLLQGFDHPLPVLARSVACNFYPLLAVLLVFLVVFTGWDLGPMRRAEQRALKEGKILADGARPAVASEITLMESKEGVPRRAMNMILPIALMVLAMPLMLVVTGWDQITDPGQKSLAQKIIEATGKSSGAESVLYSVLVSLIVSIILYRAQKIFSLREMTSLALKGMSGMVPMALLMLLAFAIGNLCNELGTGIFVAEATRSWLSPSLAPLLIFMVSCFIAFSTGTSWGTFAIMIPIAIPVAQSLDSHLYMAIAAALGGGVFGDHCSPISDTTLISSMATASDHIDHVRTQLPYALVAGVLSALIYLFAGLLG